MELNTKENPGCYHSMMAYLSEVSGMPTTKTISFDRSESLYKMPHPKSMKQKRKLLYKSYHITVIDWDGNPQPFMLNNIRWDERGVKARRFDVEVDRDVDEFNVPIESAGKYKDSLGGGWYSIIPLYRIHNQFFAPAMECGH